MRLIVLAAVEVSEDQPVVELSVGGEAPEQGFEELVHWLSREPALRGRVRRASRTVTAGTLGPGAAVLEVAVGGGGALTVLATSLKTFLSLPRRSDVKITVTSAQDGTRTVEIDAKRVDDVVSLICETLSHEE